MLNVDDEEVPITEHTKTPPPPLPTPPTEVIEIIENEKEVEETLIESTETDKDQIVEVVPKSKQRKCFQKMIFMHINKTVRYPEIAQEIRIQEKVYMRFVIEKDGSITNIEVLRSPDRN